MYVHDEGTPAVLSLGKLCQEHGYTYEWLSGCDPRQTKNGQQTFCRTGNFVPLVVPGQSSNSTTTSSSTSPLQDLSISLDAANMRSHDGVTGNCSEEVQHRCS